MRASCGYVASLHLTSGGGRGVVGSALGTGLLTQRQQRYCRTGPTECLPRQDFSYKNLCMNDSPDSFSRPSPKIGLKTTKYFVLGENRTED